MNKFKIVLAAYAVTLKVGLPDIKAFLFLIGISIVPIKNKNAFISGRPNLSVTAYAAKTIIVLTCNSIF